MHPNRLLRLVLLALEGEAYSAGRPSSRWLAHCQRAFDTVELNSPFYHWPRPAAVQNWARQAPPGFQHSIKDFLFSSPVQLSVEPGTLPSAKAASASEGNSFSSTPRWR